MPRIGAGIRPTDQQAVQTIERARVQGCREARVGPEDDIGLPQSVVARVIGVAGTDDQVTQAIAIDVATAIDGETGVVLIGATEDHETIAAVQIG